MTDSATNSNAGRALADPDGEATPTRESAIDPAELPAKSDRDETASLDVAAQGMIPARSRRRTKTERASMRVLATGGIIGLATALGAILVAQHVAGWIVGLSVGLSTVVLAALLWSSRQL